MKLIEQKIESLLFFKNEPLSFAWLSKKIGSPIEVIKETVQGMVSYYENRGIVIVISEDSVALMTSESSQELLADLMNTKDERELSKQALETLAIIAYKGRATKPEIDYIRGVNSVFILRNLLIRGLITKTPNRIDKRSPFYTPTHDLLSFLGLTDIRDLPQSQAIRKKIQEVEDQFEQAQKQEAQEPVIINKESSTLDREENETLDID